MFTAFQKAKAKKGFTLVELIVVISIIAILMLVLVPSLLAYINKANMSKASSNAKINYNAILAVYTDAIANDASYTESSLVSDAIAKDLIEDANHITVKLDSNNEIEYVTWKKESGTSVTDAATKDGDDKGTWARWPKL